MDPEDLKGQRVALYARYSSEHQSSASIEDQLRRLRAELERRGGAFEPNLVFADHAISGASMQRPAFEQMVRLVDQKPRGIDVILVEDLSRIGRDSADLFMLQRVLEFQGVRLIGVADGVDTFAGHSRLTYGLKALVSSMYLHDLRDKTKRGLVGRALKGFSTGGLPFGFTSRRVNDDGSEIVIDEERAALVRRIFALYLEGRSCADIAGLLNREGIPSPRAHTKSQYRGWVHSTIREMLKNESYIGTFTYGKRRWMKAPGTNKRRARAADPSELVRQERLELAIVDRATWDAVQERREAIRAHYAGARDGKVKSNPGRRTQYLFSGLLYCNACGGPMVIAGGSACMYYRCSTALKRKTCSNTLSVREPIVRASLLEELRHRLASDEGIAYARKRIVQRLAEMDHQRAAKIREQQKKLATLESEVNKLADTVVSGVRSPTILARLADTERSLESAKHDLQQLEAYRATPIKLPSPDEILDLAFQLDDRLTADVTRGRELLRRLFKDGRITLIPQPGGYYLARSEILPLVLLTKTPPDSSSEGVQFPPVSCAGRI